MSKNLVFLKLGGSLLTDKAGEEALRSEVLARIAGEIAQARLANPDLRVVLGHGSGSYGHVAGARYGTRLGVAGLPQWYGFAVVSDAAARLNRLVISSLLAADVPAVGIPPSASAKVTDGRIINMAIGPIEAALEAGLVPVVFGDVAFDTVRGGTIISTEEVMEYLAGRLRPEWLLLAGETMGVYDLQGQTIQVISRDSLDSILPALGGSRGTDVTGGMVSKVSAMLDLVAEQPGLRVRIFSGLEPGLLGRILSEPYLPIGTLLQ